jgi:hypothetical protein
MESYWLMSDLGKERFQGLLRDAEEARRVLRSKKVSKFPMVLQSLVIFLIFIT